MIAQGKIKNPLIDFGLGVLYKTISLGETVTVWQNTPYDTSEYSMQFTFSWSEKVSDFQYKITPEEKGIFEVQLTAIPVKKGAALVSNTITLKVL